MKKIQGQSFYFVGIGGVGMSSVAGLLKEAGATTVTGSDQNIYPPTSDLLDSLKISALSPYCAKNITNHKDHTFIIGNSHSKNHVEVQEIVRNNLKYTSYPKLLSDTFLGETKNIVISGTHGKTSTSSLVAHILKELDEDPSYLIGGSAYNLKKGSHLGKGCTFVLEGDEYDTAFFDKGSKFLHYKPSFVVFNNIENDHVDIFPTLSAIEATFHKLLDLSPNPQNIIANWSDQGVRKVIRERGIQDKITKTSTQPQTSKGCEIYLDPSSTPSYNKETCLWEFNICTELWGMLSIKTQLPGTYNAANLCQALATISRLTENNLICPPNKTDLLKAIKNFQGVAKRFDYLGENNGIHVYLDFAHHPTSVDHVISTLKSKHPGSRVFVAFEPKNASSRRNIFHDRFRSAFKRADFSLIAPPQKDDRLNESEKLNPELLSQEIGLNSICFKSFKEILTWLLDKTQKGDVVAFLSCGNFGGVPSTFAKKLKEKNIDS